MRKSLPISICFFFPFFWGGGRVYSAHIPWVTIIPIKILVTSNAEIEKHPEI